MSKMGAMPPMPAIYGGRPTSPRAVFQGLAIKDADHGHPEAQRFFDQGVNWVRFNHAEAIRSFRAAARLDPNCAMGWLGRRLRTRLHHQPADAA